MSNALNAGPPPPGALRRAAAGAWQVEATRSVLELEQLDPAS
jgi:hypothetical protein